jgi:hypothetical protein
MFNQWRILSYKLYKWRLNFINNKRIKKGEMPISDNRGYPFIASDYKDVTAKGLPKPSGKLFYFEN